jgi:hypothetical protein
MLYDVEMEFCEDVAEGAAFGNDEIAFGTCGNRGMAEVEGPFDSAPLSDEREEGDLFMRF